MIEKYRECSLLMNLKIVLCFCLFHEKKNSLSVGQSALLRRTYMHCLHRITHCYFLADSLVVEALDFAVVDGLGVVVEERVAALHLVVQDTAGRTKSEGFTEEVLSQRLQVASALLRS